VSSLRATAVVAIFLPRRSDGLVAGGEVAVALGGRPQAARPRTRSAAPRPSPAYLGDVPVLDRAVAAAPVQAASLRAEPKRLTPPTSARRTSAMNGPTSGNWARILSAGSDLAPLVHLPVHHPRRILAIPRRRSACAPPTSRSSPRSSPAEPWRDASTNDLGWLSQWLSHVMSRSSYTC
jgi:hypothetical protein